MYNVGRRIGEVGSVYWSGCTEREWLVWKGVTLDSDVRGDLEKEIFYIREHLHVSQLEGEDGEMGWARMRMSGAGRRMGDLPRVRVGRIDTSSPRSSPPLPLEISPFLPLLGRHNRRSSDNNRHSAVHILCQNFEYKTSIEAKEWWKLSHVN